MKAVSSICLPYISNGLVWNDDTRIIQRSLLIHIGIYLEVNEQEMRWRLFIL